MNWFAGLRLLVFARRCTRALESIAASQRDVAMVMRGQWELDHPVRRKVKTSFDQMDVAEVNKRWRADRVAEGIEDAEE